MIEAGVVRRGVRIAPAVAWGLAAVLTTAGCGSVASRLLADRDAPAFADLLDAGSRCACRVRSVRPEDDGVAAVRLAVEERGTGDRERVLVLIHGVLADRRAWRFVAGDLGRDHDILLLDLPGCGESDCPTPGDRGPEDYGPTALARCVLATLRGRLADRPADVRVTLVGHSLGGSIVLRMLGDKDLRDEFADVRARVDSTVMFAPVDFAMQNPPAALRAIAGASAWEIQVGDMLGLVREQVAQSLAAIVPEPGMPLREEVDRVVETLTTGRRLRATQALIRQAVPFRDDETLDWDRAERLVADYANVDVPCLLVWGARDDTLPVSMGYKLAAELPRAKLHIVPRSTHSLPTERPVQCADLVRAFCADVDRAAKGVVACAAQAGR